MKNARALSLVALALVAALPLFAKDGDDDAAIVDVIDRAYVQGIHVDGDAEKVRAGMHDSFVMFVRTDTGVSQVTREQWISRLKPRDPAAPKPDIKAKIDVLDRSGDAAVARVQLLRDGKQIFTDYISLYRFADGWKLVGKTFQRM